MVAIYDVLKASKGIHVDDTFAELWGRKLSNAYTVATYTGTLPATLAGTKAGYLDRYKIYGNTVQDGTPTPENPIMPSGCGELETTGAHTGQYKLPILSNSTVTNIYLGEVETTRQIKKLVLTGGEVSTVDASSKQALIPLPDRCLGVVPLCSHYIGKITSAWSTIGNGEIAVLQQGSTTARICDTTYATTASSYNNFLSQQYANGTPVTIWCVLATEETGTLNEPLCKIGDYADTIDSTQTSARIPTAAGKTTISWAGEGLAPSEVELTYRKPKGQ